MRYRRQSSKRYVAPAVAQHSRALADELARDAAIEIAILWLIALGAIAWCCGGGLFA
jgi:hypothetical protein